MCAYHVCLPYKCYKTIYYVFVQGKSKPKNFNRKKTSETKKTNTENTKQRGILIFHNKENKNMIIDDKIFTDNIIFSWAYELAQALLTDHMSYNQYPIGSV